MSAAEVLQTVSAESLTLLLGVMLLLTIIVALQIGNARWLRRLASAEETSAAKARLERLLEAVEGLSAKRGEVGAMRRNRPMGKDRHVPAVRSTAHRSATRRTR